MTTEVQSLGEQIGGVAGKFKPATCGGCGATKSTERCIGCMHYFGDGDEWVLEPASTQVEGGSDKLDASAPQVLPAFETEWQKKVALGYQYGHDALEQVRFGYEIARAALQGEAK